MKTKLLAAFCCILPVCLAAQVTQINNNHSLHSIFPLANGKVIYYSDIDSSIWATDGTLANTIQISSVKYQDQSGYLNGKVYFSGLTGGNGAELYVTDGTAAGTTLVKDINAGMASSDPGSMIVFKNSLYFSAFTATQGREIWKSDGTSAGTAILKDIVPGSGSSNGSDDSFHLFPTSTFILFAAQTPGSGVELWKSDGTTSGTNLLLDIYAGADSSNPREFYLLNSTVLFFATDATHGEELWKTDGSAGGTVLLKDINPGAGSSTVQLFSGIPINLFNSFHTFNNKAFFNASDGTSTSQVWSTDGTSANTGLLVDITHSTTSFSVPLVFDAANYPTFFIFPFGDHISRAEFWKSDGTPGGTALFKSFSPATAGQTPLIYPPYYVNFSAQTFGEQLFQGNKFFFVESSVANGNELWVCDGTAAGITMVKDINPGANDGIQTNETFLYTTTGLYFAADDGVHGNELWTSDGTSGGTSMVKDINPNLGDADPEIDPGFVVNHMIYFTATDGDNPDQTDLFVVNGSFNALPVKLTSFTVLPKDNDALLQWTVQQEINSKDYTVQRSFDGEHFEDIGIVPAAGNSSSPLQYSFTDAGIMNAGHSVVYYRLNEQDKDDRSSLTNIISLHISGSTSWAVRLLSNPVQNDVSLMLNNISGNLKLSITDLNGRILYTKTMENVNGQISLPVVLPKGMYILEAINNSQRQVLQFVK
jgi:ELWxxDGT repeat protein